MEPKLQKVVLWYIAKKQYISQTKQQNLIRCEVVTIQEVPIAPVRDGRCWKTMKTVSKITLTSMAKTDLIQIGWTTLSKDFCNTFLQLFFLSKKRDITGGPTDLLWSKKRDVTDKGFQLTSFGQKTSSGPKNVTLATGG